MKLEKFLIRLLNSNWTLTSGNLIKLNFHFSYLIYMRAPEKISYFCSSLSVAHSKALTNSSLKCLRSPCICYLVCVPFFSLIRPWYTVRRETIFVLSSSSFALMPSTWVYSLMLIMRLLLSSLGYSNIISLVVYLAAWVLLNLISILI